jgi:hypothetical protein
MHMHVTTGAGMRQTELIRKSRFVGQCRREAGLTEYLA